MTAELPPIDNGASPLAGGRPPMRLWQWAAIGGVGIAAVVGTQFAWNHYAAGSKPKDDTAGVMVATGGGQPFNPPTLAPPPPKVTPAVFQGPPPAMPAPAPPAFITNAAPVAAPGKPAHSLLLAGSPGNGAAPAPAPQPHDDAAHLTGAAGSPLGDKLKPTLLEGARASLLPHPLFTITMGTMIPCIQDTAIQTDQPGFVRCHVPVDIYGERPRDTSGNPFGGVVLLDKGTRIVGQLQQSVMQGQSRVFVLWTRAETPNHVIVNLDSPATDEIGRGGLDGDINTHFFQRFGGALMLSFVDSGLQAAALAASRAAGGNTTLFQMSGGESAAGEALRGSVNIPPTLSRPQGSLDAVFVAKDLDFSDVYSLRVAQ